MDVFLLLSNIVLIIFALGTWFFPEAANLPLRFRVGISILIGLILTFSLTGRVILTKLQKISPTLQQLTKNLIQKITHPLAKATYVLVMLLMVVYISGLDTKVIFLALGILFLHLTSERWFLVKNVRLSETFDDGMASWKVVSGNPSINDQFGNPSPCLDLQVVQGVKTNCFLELLPVETPEKGTIECDVYLEHGSLFNIVFRADVTNQKWYMARLETRGGSEDSILKNDGQGWKFLGKAGANSSPSTWHRMKVEIDGHKAKLYRDGKKLVEIEDSDFKKGLIGIFNEVGMVHVDNFSVQSLN